MAPDARVGPSTLRAIALPARFTWVTTAAVALALAMAVSALPLELSAVSAVGGLLIVLALVEPLVALAALVALLPFSTLMSVDVGDFSITILEPLVVVLLALWLIRGVPRREITLSGGQLLVPLSVVLIAILISTLAAERSTLAMKETFKWLELAVVFIFTASYLRGRNQQLAMLGVLFVAGAAEAIYGAFQYATGQGPAAFTVGETLRAYGHFEQPNPFAGYLGTILPLAVAMAWLGRPRSFALLAAVAGIPVAAGIVLSLSRGAWVGVALACAAMMAGWSDTSRRLLPWITGFVLVVVLLAGSGLLPIGWSERLTAVTANLGVFDASSVDVTPENFAVVERMAHWQAAWQMFLEHPLLGVGAGNYPAAYERYSLPGWSEPLGHAHNYYLNVAAESGVLGLVAIMLLIGSIYLALATGLKHSEPRSFQRAVLVGLSGSFVVLCVHNLFDNLLVHGMPLQIGLLMGLVVQNAGPADHLAKAVPRLSSN